MKIFWEAMVFLGSISLGILFYLFLLQDFLNEAQRLFLLNF